MSNPFNEVIGLKTPKTQEDESFQQTDSEASQCPYGKCNGSGIIPSEQDKRDAIFCECHQRDVMIQKLKNANINTNFIDIDFDSLDEETKTTLFKPKKTPDEFKPNTKVKKVLDETPKNFINRHYSLSKKKRSLQDILVSYSEKNLERLRYEKPTANLMLFGDPGNGKTSFAALIGKYFLQQNKKVYFSKTQEFIDQIFNKEINPKQVAKDVDVLILDELFNEYHTDSEFAKKQLQEIFKTREEIGKITICTSNGDPKGFYLLYGDSMMSLINGSFFMFHLERETDGRVENIHDMYDDFDL